MDEPAHKVSRERLEEAMERGGIHGALRFLNARSPYRYTAIYRFVGEMVRNLYLFDRLGTVSADPSPVSWAIHFVDLSEHQASSAPATRLRTRGLTGIQNGKSSSPALACHCLETQGSYSEVSAISTHFRNQSLMTKFPSWSRLHPS